MNRIARNAQTFSKSPDQFIKGVYPTSCEYGDHHKLYGNDGKYYLDTISSLGAILGDNKPVGMFSLPFKYEEELAELICQRTGMDMVRLMCNGGDATFAAITYARAHSKRQLVLSTGYHGSAGHWSYCTPPGLGCVDGQILKFSTIEEMTTYITDHTAAVIIEPVELRIDEKVIDDLRKLRAKCDKHGVCLIYDEVITGGRFLKFCVANWSFVKPDLICMGKALGGGYPLSILTGKKEWMEDEDVFVSFTFGGFPAAIQESIKLIKELTDEKLEEFWKRGAKWQYMINSLEYPVELLGYPTRMTWNGDNKDVWLLWQECCKKGLLLGRAFFPRITWDDGVWQDIFLIIKDAVETIKADKPHLTYLPKPTFREIRND